MLQLDPAGSIVIVAWMAVRPVEEPSLVPIGPCDVLPGRFSKCFGRRRFKMWEVFSHLAGNIFWACTAYLCSVAIHNGMVEHGKAIIIAAKELQKKDR